MYMHIVVSFFISTLHSEYNFRWGTLLTISFMIMAKEGKAKIQLHNDLTYWDVWSSKPCHPSKVMQSTRILGNLLAVLYITCHVHWRATLSSICCIGIFSRLMSGHIWMLGGCRSTTQFLKFLIKLTIIITNFWLAKILSKQLTLQEK